MRVSRKTDSRLMKVSLTDKSMNNRENITKFVSLSKNHRFLWSRVSSMLSTKTNA